MHLNIDIDTSKSNIFLDLLTLLKKDNMINDFQVITTPNKLTSYEKELLQDIKEIPKAIHNANNKQGIKKNITLDF